MVIYCGHRGTVRNPDLRYLVMHVAVALVAKGSILMFQTILAVRPIRKAVVADRHNYADRHNPIAHVT